MRVKVNVFGEEGAKKMPPQVSKILGMLLSIANMMHMLNLYYNSYYSLTSLEC